MLVDDVVFAGIAGSVAGYTTRVPAGGALGVTGACTETTSIHISCSCCHCLLTTKTPDVFASCVGVAR